MTKPRKGLSICDLEKQVADQMIELMKTHGLKWVQRWQRPRPACNGLTGHVYSGVNVLTTSLWLMSQEQDDPRFVARSRLFCADDTRVGTVRKGEKGIPITFYGTAKGTDESGEDTRYRFGKLHRVWHVSQLADLDESKLVDPAADAPPEDPAERDIGAELFLTETGARILHSGSRAFYRPADDTITLPPVETFYSGEGYYSTALHELVHWTGAAKRLNRGFSFERDADYAFEELVAEIGSVILGMQLGIQAQPREDNAAYVKGWMKLLKDQPRAIFDATRKASAAATFLNDLQATQQEAA